MPLAGTCLSHVNFCRLSLRDFEWQIIICRYWLCNDDGVVACKHLLQCDHSMDPVLFICLVSIRCAMETL